MKQQLDLREQKKQILLDMLAQHSTQKGLSIDDKFEFLQNQLLKSQSDLLSTQNELREKEMQINRLVDYTLQLEEDIKVKNTEIDELLRDKSNINIQLTDTQRRYEDLESEHEESINRLNKEIEDLKGQLKKQEITNQIQNNSFDGNFNETEWKKEKFELLRKLDDRNRVIRDQSLQIHQMINMQDKLQKNIITMREDHKKSKEIIQNLKSEIENLRKIEEEKSHLYEMDKQPNNHYYHNNHHDNILEQMQSPTSIMQSPLQNIQPHQYNLQSPHNARLTGFNTQKDFDHTPPPYKVGSSRMMTKPQSSNSLNSAYTSAESKKKLMGNFKKLTSMAVGLYSNMLDYQSLQSGSLMAQELTNAKVDLSQAVAKRNAKPTAADFQDNN